MPLTDDEQRAICHLRQYFDALANGAIREPDAAKRETVKENFIAEVTAYQNEGPEGYLDHSVAEKRDRMLAWDNEYRDGLAAKQAELAAEKALLQSEIDAGRDGPNDAAYNACLARIAACETWLNYRLGLKEEFET